MANQKLRLSDEMREVRIGKDTEREIEVRGERVDPNDEALLELVEEKRSIFERVLNLEDEVQRLKEIVETLSHSRLAE